MKIKNVDMTVIKWLRVSFLPVARVAIFVVYFYFGVLKLFGQSPATPLATALAAKTIGLQHFTVVYDLLAVYECLIGLLFLVPKATRIVIPLLFIHLVIVSSPLILVPHLAWAKYIIKNIAIIALAIGVAAQTKPLKQSKVSQSGR
jgi:uncharacterized membrane protein YphA (DoxX/SURF4 family)